LATTSDPPLIDREAERDLFGRLITLEEEARVITLRDRGGQGKSSLLRVLRHSCIQRPTPVSLVSLAELDEYTPLALVRRIQKDLRRSRLEFPKFEELDAERLRRTPPRDLGNALETAVDQSAGRYSGAVRADHAQFHDSEVIGQKFTVELPAADDKWLSPEEQEKLGERSIEAFFEELTEHCRNRVAVLMIDAFDRAPASLAQWMLEDFLRWYCFDLQNRPARLVVVVAGRDVPDCEGLLGPVRYSRLVRPIRELTTLEDRHVRELFTRGGVEPTDEEVRILRDAIRQGMTIKTALQTVEDLRQGREGPRG
jgi:hypothetical protein